MNKNTSVDAVLFTGGLAPLPESGRLTGMYKQQAIGEITVSDDGFVGDQQADKRVHGGPEKAVHSFPSGHYLTLAAQFPEAAALLVPGSIGENISTTLNEHDVRIGDVWRLGSARLEVCQPRNPCWKIDERYCCEGMAQFISEHKLTGWYWRVVQQGSVQAGDQLVLDDANESAPTLYESMTLWCEHRPDTYALEQLSRTKGIAQQWKLKIDARLTWLRKNSPSVMT